LRENRPARATGKARTKTKYRDLSTAAAKCAAFGRDDVRYGLGKEQATAVEMTFGMGGLQENKQPQEQRQRQGKSWLVDGIHSHLSDDKTVAKMGTQTFCVWFREGNAAARSKDEVRAFDPRG